MGAEAILEEDSCWPLSVSHTGMVGTLSLVLRTWYISVSGENHLHLNVQTYLSFKILDLLGQESYLPT